MVMIICYVVTEVVLVAVSEIQTFDVVEDVVQDGDVEVMVVDQQYMEVLEVEEKKAFVSMDLVLETGLELVMPALIMVLAVMILQM